MKRNFKVWAVAGGPYSREQLEDAYNFKNFVDSRMEAIEFSDDGNISHDYSGKMC